MLIKKLILTAILATALVLLCSMVRDCMLDFSIDFYVLQDNYEANLQWCEENGWPLTGMCKNEVELEFGIGVEQLYTEMVKCCCQQGDYCCIY